MILNSKGQKRTANELAKELVLEFGMIALLWTEKLPESYADKPTERECTEIEHAIARQIARVRAFLGNPDPNRNKEDDD